ARIRPVLRADPRRPGQQHGDRRAGALQQSVPVVPAGQRGRRGRRRTRGSGPGQHVPAAAVPRARQVMATIASTTPRRRTPPQPVRRGVRTGLFHASASLLAAAFLFPLIWAALNSVKSSDEANQQPPTWLPHSLSLQNYRSLTSFDQGIGVYLVNT